MSSNASKTRIEWLDSTKGLGTLLVILGHNLGFIHGAPEWHRFIYTFHMPLFFLATGVTLKISKTKSLRDRALMLAIPYLLMSAIMVPITHHFEPNVKIAEIALGIIYGTGHTIDIVPLWFLTCTISGILLLAIISTIFQSLGKDLEKWHFSVGLLLLALGYTIIHLLPYEISFNYGWGSYSKSGLPWNMDLAPIAAGYMLIGNLLAGKMSDTDRSGKISFGLISIGCWVLLFVLVFEFGAKLDLNYRRIDPSLLGIAGSILGVTGSITLCILIQPLRLLTKCLSYVTQSGLIILWLHGGLQNKGFKIIFGSNWIAPDIYFWVFASIFATITPIIIDRHIIKKTPLKEAFYPKFK